jgi:type I restriction enzyme S subunit
MSYKRLGDYIQLVDKRNKDLAVTNLLGVSIQKKFIPSIANITGTDMSVYRKIKKNQFAFSPVTSRNGEKITVALLKEVDEAILSPAYQVFEAKDKNRLIPEYLFIWFNRSEFDRYARFNSWGSARETFNWDDMCDVKLPIPDIEEQRKYIALYKGLLNNQKVYENSLDDLQLICDTYIEDLIKIEESKLLGEYIERTNERNTDDAIKEVRGMSTKKQFRIAQSRVDTKKLTNYRIVKTNEFAYVPTTDTWKVLAVALSNFNFPVVVSPIYVTFKSKNTNLLLPEYLFLFLTRTELDRYARFHSWGSARENFNWDDMCNIKLPIPDIKIQEAIVTIYHTLETRKRINEQLKASIKPLCPVLMRGVVKEMEKEETVT